MAKDETESSYPLVIFLPSNINSEHCVLCGEVSVNNTLKTKNYFIHFSEENAAHNIIGGISTNVLKPSNRKNKDWLTLTVSGTVPVITQVISDDKDVTSGDYQIVLYDKSRFTKSQLLFPSNTKCESIKETMTLDHFKCLINSLRAPEKCPKPFAIQPFVLLVLINSIRLLKCLEHFIDKFQFLLKFSTLAIHMSSFIHNSIWCLEDILNTKGHLTLKNGNFILALIADWLGGVLIVYWFLNLMRVEEVLQLLASKSEVIVAALEHMVHYLMGSPADLKLNGPLNSVLGKFFLFHIDLWWAFLGYSRPLLEFGFKMFICLGSLGLSFQIAILADLLAIASFHVYIIYVYAARLYNVQVAGLVSLSRVFLGRKRNPVPGRVDSCPYSTEQLLIGTISFTVLLFLLPTTLVYYIVFTAIRLVLIAVGGLLTQARFLLRAVPLYTTLLWLFNSPLTTSCVKLTPAPCSSPQGFLLEATPVQGAWWPTVRSTVAEVISPPPEVKWGDIFWDLLSGRLLYPV